VNAQVSAPEWRPSLLGNWEHLDNKRSPSRNNRESSTVCQRGPARQWEALAKLMLAEEGFESRLAEPAAKTPNHLKDA
jgi:hypothetical protein